MTPRYLLLNLRRDGRKLKFNIRVYSYRPVDSVYICMQLLLGRFEGSIRCFRLTLETLRFTKLVALLNKRETEIFLPIFFQTLLFRRFSLYFN